jgi:hypothetical protein
VHLALGLIFVWGAFGTWVGFVNGVLCALGFYLVGCFLLRGKDAQGTLGSFLLKGKDAQGTLGSFLLKGAQGTWVCLCTWWFVVVFDLVLDC